MGSPAGPVMGGTPGTGVGGLALGGDPLIPTIDTRSPAGLDVVRGVTTCYHPL